MVCKFFVVLEVWVGVNENFCVVELVLKVNGLIVCVFELIGVDDRFNVCDDGWGVVVVIIVVLVVLNWNKSVFFVGVWDFVVLVFGFVNWNVFVIVVVVVFVVFELKLNDVVKFVEGFVVFVMKANGEEVVFLVGVEVFIVWKLKGEEVKFVVLIVCDEVVVLEVEVVINWNVVKLDFVGVSEFVNGLLFVIDDLEFSVEVVVDDDVVVVSKVKGDGVFEGIVKENLEELVV